MLVQQLAQPLGSAAAVSVDPQRPPNPVEVCRLLPKRGVDRHAKTCIIENRSQVDDCSSQMCNAERPACGDVLRKRSRECQMRTPLSFLRTCLEVGTVICTESSTG